MNSTYCSFWIDQYKKWLLSSIEIYRPIDVETQVKIICVHILQGNTNADIQWMSILSHRMQQHCLQFSSTVELHVQSPFSTTVWLCETGHLQMYILKASMKDYKSKICQIFWHHCTCTCNLPFQFHLIHLCYLHCIDGTVGNNIFFLSWSLLLMHELHKLIHFCVGFNSVCDFALYWLLVI